MQFMGRLAGREQAGAGIARHGNVIGGPML